MLKITRTPRVDIIVVTDDDLRIETTRSGNAVIRRRNEEGAGTWITIESEAELQVLVDICQAYLKETHL